MPAEACRRQGAKAGTSESGACVIYEHHSDDLLPRPLFVRRVAKHWALGLGFVVVSLLIGTAGYHWFALQPWIDAFLNASMLLGGMGQVGAIEQTGGKLFASFYALYAGIVLLGVSAVMVAPIVHRGLHKIHLSEQPPRKRRKGQ